MSRTLYTDQTSKFLRTSNCGKKDQMIVHEVDSNSTLVEPMKNRTEGEIIIARKRALKRIRFCGLKPRHKSLENEASDKYKEATCASGMTYQLIQQGDHHPNITEKSIQFCRDHFITLLSGADVTFPLHLWCQVIPQA